MKSVQLAEVCAITDGTHFTPPNVGGPYPFLTVKDMTEEGLSFSSCSRISLADFEQARRGNACPPLGSVLFSKDGTVGKVHVVREERPFAVLSSIAILRPDPRFVDSSFLGFVLQRSDVSRDAENKRTGSALTRIILSDLKCVAIPLPQLAEQRRIASQLAEADHLRRIRRYALGLSDGLAFTVFRELFDKERLPAVSVAELAADEPNAIRTGPFGSQLLHSEFTDQGVAVLGIDNVVSNRFEWSERRFITQEKFTRLKRYTVHPGDVLITIMGTCGRCAVVPGEIETAINTKHLSCITLNHARCLPAFLHGAFLYDSFVRHQLKAATKGAIMDGLNMEIIRGLDIRLPPLHAQQRYANLVDAQALLQASQREALRQAEHLFQTLLHRAFA
jgi:type I restriction enzyme S subunit